MSERRADFELLRAFSRQGDQEAFATVTRRHLDLVYATAVRKVTDDGAAEEICQNVFGVLARKAWQFAPDDSLPSWLHRTTLLESKSWLRGELRRRRREQTAAELGTTMKTSDEQPAFNALVPLLDDALLSLRDKDRTALLLRYHESQSLRDVGVSLGTSEDAARKRVSAALEKLAEFFQRRGFKTATVAATTAALQKTAVSASATTASAVVNAALQSAPPALVGLGALLARLAGLTKAQTVAACVVVAALPVAWQWSEARSAEKQAVGIRTMIEDTRARYEDVSFNVERLQSELARLETAFAAASQSHNANDEARQKIEALKMRIRGLLTENDYRWPADVPFVRIPKWALTLIDMGVPVMPPGEVQSNVRELLGLTPQEREATENALKRHFSVMERLMTERAYSTNQSAWKWMERPNAATNLVFAVPELGRELSESANTLLADVAATLADERVAFIQRGTNDSGRYSLSRILGLNAADERQEVSVWIDQMGTNPPTVGYTWNGTGKSSGAYSTAGLTLAAFLPDSEIGRDIGHWNFKTATFSSEVARRITSWLEDEARARLPHSSNP